MTIILLTHANSLIEDTVIYQCLARLSIANLLQKHIVCRVRIRKKKLFFICLRPAR